MPKLPKPAAPDIPPYLKQVRVRDYRSIRNAKVEFKPGLNIIIGENGAGKTNFLSLTSSLIPLFEDAKRAPGCELTIQYKDTFHISFENRNEYSERGKRHIKIKDYISVNINNKSRVEAEYLMEAFEQLVKDQPFYETISIIHGIPNETLSFLSGQSNLILSKQGKIHIENISKLSYFISKIIAGIEEGAYILNQHTKQNSANLSIESMKDIFLKTINLQLDFINNKLSTNSPIQTTRVNESLQIYYNDTQEEYLINGFSLEFKINDSWLPFNALSDGTKRIFYIISELFTQDTLEIDIIDNKIDMQIYDVPKIIFLEEPEIGIHPDQLQKLLSLIREVSRENQVILTTHSPQVLDMLTKNELDRITICELDPKKGTQFRKLSAAKKAKAKAYMQNDSYLSDFWRFSNLEDPD